MLQQWQHFLKDYNLIQQFAEDAGWITDLNHTLGLIKVEGSDAKKFLQGQLTCNVDEISTTATRLGAHCNPQGRMISLFRLFYYHESYYLHMPLETIPLALTALQKYAVFFKVKLTNASHDLLSIGYHGEPFATVPENLLIIEFPEKSARYQIIGLYQDIIHVWEKLAKNHSHVPASAWKIADINAHIPSIYPETSEKFLPHDLHLHELNGISFNKGCYTGQEIIARMHYRGKLKKQLLHLDFHSLATPQRGENINNTGILVDFCQKTKDNYELLILC